MKASSATDQYTESACRPDSFPQRQDPEVVDISLAQKGGPCSNRGIQKKIRYCKLIGAGEGIPYGDRRPVVSTEDRPLFPEVDSHQGSSNRGREVNFLLGYNALYIDDEKSVRG